MSGLEVEIRRKVHDGLHLNLAFTVQNECAVLFGPSGTGKSTTLRMIAGLLTPDAGRIILDGEPLFDSNRRENRPLRLRRVGMVFQDDRLFPHLDVASNILYGLNRWESAKARERLAEIAALCGVGSLLDRSPSNLSGGERQRVGLARALAPRPKLLLCDEPVSALDLENRQALTERLRAVQAAESIPMLYVTHSPAEAIAVGHRLLRLEGGSIVDSGLPIEVLTATPATYQNRLERVLNRFEGRVLDPEAGAGETRVQLTGGPELIVANVAPIPGTIVNVEILADEILLARDNVEGLSARNQLRAEVVKILGHGNDAEILLRTGNLTWIASLTRGAVAALRLQAGQTAWMIIKARSCLVRDPT